jgi:hypothetical protein
MPSHKKCSPGKIHRKSHMRSGKRVAGQCVKKGRKSRSGKRSVRRSSHKCSPGKVWRKAHKSASGKRVAGKCVKKGGRKSRSRSARKM